MSTLPGPGLPSPRRADPLTCFLWLPKRQERALPTFPKLFTYLQMLEGTIQQLCDWLSRFLEFRFTNSNCNRYILISKDRRPLSHFPSLALVHAHVICCWLGPHGKETHDLCFTPACRIRKGYTNAECYLPYLRPDPFLQESLLQLCGATPHLHHGKVPAQQSIRTVLISNSSQGRWGRWRDLKGARNRGFTTKTVLLETEGHNQGKNKINHLV